MKILSKIVLVLSITTLFFSCSKNDTTDTTSTKSILAMAQNQPNLTTFVQALQLTGLDATLSASGNSTVFAPTNDAFTAFLTANSFANLNAVPVATLKKILLNHVINLSYKSTDLVNNSYLKTNAYGSVSPTPTPTTAPVNSLSMLVTNAGNVIKLNNNATVIVPNLVTDNGVLHIVDKVIGLPRLTDLLTANTNFSKLVSLLKVTGQQDFTMSPYLGSVTGVTVFAPTNTAFSSLETELGITIGSPTATPPVAPVGITPAMITSVLKYHFVNTNINSSSLVAGSVATLLTPPTTGFTFTVNTTLGPKLIDQHLPLNRTSSITATDIQANNGVIHVLDKVLLNF